MQCTKLFFFVFLYNPKLAFSVFILKSGVIIVCWQNDYRHLEMQKHTEMTIRQDLVNTWTFSLISKELQWEDIF